MAVGRPMAQAHTQRGRGALHACVPKVACVSTSALALSALSAWPCRTVSGLRQSPHGLHACLPASARVRSIPPTVFSRASTTIELRANLMELLDKHGLGVSPGEKEIKVRCGTVRYTRGACSHM